MFGAADFPAPLHECSSIGLRIELRCQALDEIFEVVGTLGRTFDQMLGQRPDVVGEERLDAAYRGGLEVSAGRRCLDSGRLRLRPRRCPSMAEDGACDFR